MPIYMNINQQREAIREACIAAGARLTSHGCTQHWPQCNNGDCNLCKTTTFRDIRLADVLLAIQENHKNKGDILITSVGIFGSIERGNLGHLWNLLNDSLDSQSDETISFLFNIIKKK